jgi:hypothetical protein
LTCCEASAIRDSSASSEYQVYRRFFRTLLSWASSTHFKSPIVHVRDWHLVDQELFGTDEEYAVHKKTVVAVQASQWKILADVPEVFIEGLSPRDEQVFSIMLAVQKKMPHGDTLLHLGAAARLVIDKGLKVLPAEADGFEVANPVKDGKVVIDEAIQEKREDAIVRRLSAKKGKVYLLLGDAHDLKDKIRRLSDNCGYWPSRARAIRNESAVWLQSPGKRTPILRPRADGNSEMSLVSVVEKNGGLMEQNSNVVGVF